MCAGVGELTLLGLGPQNKSVTEPGLGEGMRSHAG